MKKIVLVRHAKAVDSLMEINDSERSLKVKGIVDAHKVAGKLISLGIKPETIITSTAFRAFETASIFAEEFHYPKKSIILSDSLYFDYSTKDFVEMVQKQDDNIKILLICAHNPNISAMASQYLLDFHHDMPTCGVVVIEFNAEKWSNINIREGKLCYFVFPEK